MRRHYSIFAAGLLAAALACGLALPAAADDGWYFTADTGVNYVPDLTVHNSITRLDPTKVENSLGMTILAGGGYAFGPVRIEGEVGWRTNGIDSTSTPGLGSGSGNGEIDPYSFMANAYYDIDTGSKFTPYLGAGVGGVDLEGTIGRGGYTVTQMGSVGLGYQGIAGVAYKINDQLSIKADYHYLATTETSLSDDAGSVGPGTAKMTYVAHSFLVGFIYRFGEPPAPMPATAAAAATPAAPAPEPAPPPAPPPPTQVHSFLVFFDFDKALITADARQTIEKAVAAFKNQGAARINLTGHTDTVGTAPYNYALSLRRAEAVKKVLVEMGIADAEISVVGKGKTEPLVPTGDGVREPKNRRVEIVLP